MQDIYNDIKPVSYYNEFNGTQNLPFTSIIKTIQNDYVSYLNLNKDTKYTIVLSDLFSLNLEEGLNDKGTIVQTNKPNLPSFLLTDLIKVAIYLKSSDFLVKTTTSSYQFQLTNLKFQVGKDVSRIKIIIDNSELNVLTNGLERDEQKGMEEEKEANNYQIADKFNQKVIENFKTTDINYNTLLMMDILSCQNIFNLMADLLHLFINEKLEPYLKGDTIILSPSARADTNGKETVSNDKYIKIDVSKDSSKMTIYFDSFLFLVSEFVSIGRLNYTITFDFINNSYILDELNINYDLNSINIQQTNNNINNENKDNKNLEQFNKWKQTISTKSKQYWNNTKEVASNIKNKTSDFIKNNPKMAAIGIPVGVAAVGAATVLGAAVLGGKRKRIKSKKRINTKNKKTKKRKSNWNKSVKKQKKSLIYRKNRKLTKRSNH
jgi:hypothetical protein